MTTYISTFLLALLIVTSRASGSECQLNPVHLLVFFDATRHAERVSEETETLAVGVIAAMAKGSEIVIDRVENNKDMKMMNFTKTDDRTWSIKMRTHPDMKQYGDTSSISSEALEDGFTKSFSVNPYRKKAEITVLFIDNKTKLDKVTPKLTKKKTYVVMIGAISSDEATWKLLATTKHHFFTVRSLDEVDNVMNSLIKQIACDSNHSCNTDMYKQKWSIRCRFCSDKCVEGNSRRNGTCEKYCPYLHVPTIHNETTPPTVKEAVSDNLILILVPVAYILEIVLALGAGIACYCICKRRKSHSPTPAPENLPVPETVGEMTSTLNIMTMQGFQ